LTEANGWKEGGRIHCTILRKNSNENTAARGDNPDSAAQRLKRDHTVFAFVSFVALKFSDGFAPSFATWLLIPYNCQKNIQDLGPHSTIVELFVYEAEFE
jgi:hypothetical protein